MIAVLAVIGVEFVLEILMLTERHFFGDLMWLMLEAMRSSVDTVKKIGG